MNKIYNFHPVTQEAYSSVHLWLQTDTQAKSGSKGYAQIKYSDESIKKYLNEDSLLSSAFQYYTYFPTHFFKVKHTLEEIITLDKLRQWIRFNSHICVIDIGCGAGAATVAVLDTLLLLNDQVKLEHNVKVFCIGSDPSTFATVLYERMLNRMQDNLKKAGIEVIFITLDGGIPDDTAQIISILNEQRNVWNIPHFSHVLLFQVNIVRPLSMSFTEKESKRSVARQLGSEGNTELKFGSIEVVQYAAIFDQSLIDHLHIITIGTDHYMLPKRVMEMKEAIVEKFSSEKHIVVK
jgi:hypothetical protein